MFKVGGKENKRLKYFLIYVTFTYILRLTLKQTRLSDINKLI